MRRLLLVTILLAAVAAVPLGVGVSGAATPIAPGEDTRVQPGGELHIGPALCTFNYLFKGSDGNRYIGTAGHCILQGSPVQTGNEPALEKTWAPGTGPVAQDADGKRIGEFAYAVLAEPKDFALIRLDPEVEASPQMAHFGGPTAINEDVGGGPVGIEFYGNGILLGSSRPFAPGSTLPARSGVALGLPDKDHAYTMAPASPGDSGAAVNTADGRALGVLVAGGIQAGGVSGDGVDAGAVAITRLTPQLARAAEQTGIAFELVTAPKR